MASFQNSEIVVAGPKDLGRLVRAQRKSAGLRIDDAAALCGVSVDLLSRLENGHAGVSSERLLKVLDGLGLSMIVVEKSDVSRMIGRRGSGHEPT